MSGMICTPPNTSDGVLIAIQPAGDPIWESHLLSFLGQLISGTNCLRLGSLEAECSLETEYPSKDEYSYSSGLLGKYFS